MWPFKRIWHKQNPEPNTVVHVPIFKVSVDIYKKERKYVHMNDRGILINQKKGWMESCMSKLRPKTPPGMCVETNKRLIKKLTITVYKKKRINVSAYDTSYILIWFIIYKLLQ